MPDKKASKLKKPSGQLPAAIYKPEYVQMLIEHMAEGRPFETFGAIVGYGRNKLYEWLDEYPAFGDAKRIGFEMGLHWWLEQGRKNLIINPDEKFNTAVWVFTLKAIYALRDGNESKASEENPVGKTKDQLDAFKRETDILRESLEIRKLRLVRSA